jgi:mannose-1-phosphate guanylyltransferase
MFTDATDMEKISSTTSVTSETCAGVHAVLQAGGKGTRLHPATVSLPKPLLRVGGMPMVERLLRQLVNSGVRLVSIIVGWHGEQVENHIKHISGLPADLQLEFIREPAPMGNIGALSLLPPSTAPVLFAFGDLVTDLDFNELLARHRSMGAVATLASHYETHQLTLGELHIRDSQVIDYQEKPLKKFLICSGIAVFEPPVLQLLDPTRPAGISTLIQAALANNMKVAHWIHGAFWMDINTPEALEVAEKELAQRAL